VRSALNAFLQTAAQRYFLSNSKILCAGAVQLSLLSPRAGSYDELRMLLHHTPWLKRFHGLLPMSSCTVCPCFRVIASSSQLASSNGWFFHFTRYSKYCFLLVFLPDLLSSMHSISSFCATGNCFYHWITGSSVPVPASSVL
jgi:hypothetical protein